MEGNPMAAMMNQGMHPGAMAGHGGMIGPGQNIESPAGSAAPSAHDLQQIQINEQQRLYQRQMQFLLEGNPTVAAAALHGQNAGPGGANQSSGPSQMTAPVPTSVPNQSAASGTPPASSTASSKSSSNQSEDTIELSHVTSAVFPSIRLPITKGEPMDEDCLPDVGSVSPDSGRHLSHQSELITADLGNGLDDYILRSFKGETSPGSSGKNTGSTGFSSGCESPDANSANSPSSPEFVVSTNWTNNRSASSDSGNFSPSHRPAFPVNCDFKIKAWLKFI